MSLQPAENKGLVVSQPGCSITVLQETCVKQREGAGPPVEVRRPQTVVSAHQLVW